MREILLTQGEVALCDDEDYEFLSQWEWYPLHRHRSIHARCNDWRDGKWKTLYMHQLLLNVPFGMETDHIDGNGLNNQRVNLRVCNRSQNMGNCRKYHRPTTSQYKGVSWDSRSGKWRAEMRQNGKRFFLGHFNTEEEAAIAYNKAAQKLFGEFAGLNGVR